MKGCQRGSEDRDTEFSVRTGRPLPLTALGDRNAPEQDSDSGKVAPTWQTNAGKSSMRETNDPRSSQIVRAAGKRPTRPWDS